MRGMFVRVDQFIVMTDMDDADASNNVTVKIPDEFAADVANVRMRDALLRVCLKHDTGHAVCVISDERGDACECYGDSVSDVVEAALRAYKWKSLEEGAYCQLRRAYQYGPFGKETPTVERGWILDLSARIQENPCRAITPYGR